MKVGFSARSALESWVKRKFKQAPLRIELWNGERFDLVPEPHVKLFFREPAALRHLLFPSVSSLARAYVEGEIDFDGSAADAVQVLKPLAGSNRRRRWKALVRNKHSDAEAIQYHYDVSNEFYGHWLDEEMVYSCAYFKTGQENIHEAQRQKLDHICRKLSLAPGERFLDIGCGWGALIRWAAKNYGVQAVGITLSQRQFEYASERIRKEGLSGSCRVLLCDYRDFAGQQSFDKIASVGMFEHVGIKNLAKYFERMHGLLADGGLALNHGICTSEVDPIYAGNGFGGDFIEQYVFPLGELPHIGRVAKCLSEERLELLDVESLRPHYSRTLAHWLGRLEANRSEARREVGEKRYRIWRAYLAGTAQAFSQGWITIYQVLLSKRAGLEQWPLPLTRDYLYPGDQNLQRAPQVSASW